MFLAVKAGQKQTLLAKKGKKKCPWLKNQDKNKHCWQKKEKIVPGWEKATTLRMLAGEDGC